MINEYNLDIEYVTENVTFNQMISVVNDVRFHALFLADFVNKDVHTSVNQFNKFPIELCFAIAQHCSTRGYTL